MRFFFLKFTKPLKRKKPSRTRVKDFLRLFYKALTVTDANIQLKCKIKKKWVLNYQQLFIKWTDLPLPPIKFFRQKTKGFMLTFYNKKQVEKLPWG